VIKDQSQDFSLRVEPEGPKAEIGGGVLGEGQQLSPHQIWV